MMEKNTNFPGVESVFPKDENDKGSVEDGK